MKTKTLVLTLFIALGAIAQEGRSAFEPQHYITLGTGYGWAQGDLANNDYSGDRGNEAKGGYNGEISYGYYPHQNWGIDARFGIGFFRAEFDTNFRGLNFEDFENIPGLEGITLILDESSFQTFYFSLGPTARLPLKPFDIHLGVQGGLLSYTEPMLSGTGFAFGSVDVGPIGFPYTVPYETFNDPKQITTFTYGGNLAFVFTFQEFLTVRAEASYYFANLSYDEAITVEIDDSTLPIDLPQTTFQSELARDLSAGMLQIRLGIGVRL